MKKLSNAQIVNFINATGTLRDKRLPIKLSFALKYNLKLAIDAYKVYDDTRNELLKTQKENPVAFNQALGELLSEEVELAAKTIPMSVIELTDTANYDTLTFGELDAIEFMITEESDEHPECS